MSTAEVTREAVIELVKRMPDDKLSSLYDFGRYIMRPDAEAEPTEEELAAEDAKWDETFARTTPEQWAKLKARIDASPSLPMFDENGRWLVDDYTDEDIEKAKAGVAGASKGE